MAGAELIGREELAEIQELFSREKVNLYRYGGGNYKTREFEERFASWMGVKYAHAVSSGTAAIHCALAGAGIGPGDEVITTAWTFIAPVEAISALGAIPVPVEIDETYHLDPAEIEKAITPATKAVVAIPMWAPPKMDEIEEICRKNGLILIEDAAQALGASYRGRKLGTIGSVGSFSFDAGKTLHTGEGGMIVTNDKEIYDRAAEFSDHGHMHVPGLPRGKDPRRAKGLNLRISEVTSAIGIAQLSRIDMILSKSRENKRRIKDRIKHLGNIITRPFTDE
ncbi:MAG: DegT/DnrJ/EryC1/StrS family aminotransferase, partial [Chlorobiaceae bacterium]|nr:DegT/DnrJ/EryC1/StrS family aminotransferase [Chlorobiaceae bacterium]